MQSKSHRRCWAAAEGQGGRGTPAIFIDTPAPRAHAPASAAAMLRKRGDNVRLQLTACNVGFKSPVLGGGHRRSGCRPLSKTGFGEEGTARTRLGDGGRGVSREHRRATADKDPASHVPGEVNIREPAAPFALRTQAGEQNQPKEEKA